MAVNYVEICVKVKKKRHTIDELIEKFHTIYQGKYKYDFQNFIYKNVEQKIPIICEEHGVNNSSFKI